MTLTRAKAELDAITKRFTTNEPAVAQEEGYNDYFPQTTSVQTLRDAIVGSTRRPLWILMAASALVLLVACTNLASTTLARGTAREQEYSIRHALGAGRGRMVRVIFAESFALSLMGAALGLAVAWSVLRLLVRFAPAGIPRIDNVHLDVPVLAFTMAVSLLAASLAGLLPGVRIASFAIRSLRSGTRGGDDPRRQRIWKWLVAAEMGVALLLLVGSGLLLRSFWSVLAVRPGFHTERILTATVDPPESRYGDNATKRQYYDALMQNLSALSGVESMGLVNAAPLTFVSNGMIDVDDAAKPTTSALYQVAGPGYFETIGIPVVRGRVFDSRDRDGSEPVVVVNHAFAEAVWPGQDAVGKRITGGGMDDHWQTRDRATIIGVVGDIRQSDFTRPPSPTIFFPYTQRPFRAWSMTALLRPRGDTRAESLIGPVRDAVRAVDADVPVLFSTIEQKLSGTLAARRFILMIIAAFACSALVLASVGVYGVVAYAVERRRQEIGIRLALGAAPANVRRMMQREYMTAAGYGAAAGVVLALFLTRLMQSLLFEVKPGDPLTFLGVLVVLGAAGWLASFIPLLRSTRVDPVRSMRGE